jgi:recombination associated protein RdgC
MVRALFFNGMHRANMWFKNLKLYQLTNSIELTEEQLQTQLESMSFRPCGSQDLATMGWTSPFRNSDLLFHKTDNRYWLVLKKQERILPASVVNNELAEKVAQIEAETGSPVPKKQQTDLKQEIVHRLLPQAFTKNSTTHGFISIENNLVVVDASSDGAAEAFLACVRKCIGSLPVVPFAKTSKQDVLTAWVLQDTPDDIELLDEAEFKSPSEDGAIIRCKSQDLDAEEMLAHLQSGMLVQKLAVAWQDRLTCILGEDLSVKRLKFTDVVKEQNEDIPKDEINAKLDADFTLMSAEVVELSKALRDIFEVESE